MPLADSVGVVAVREEYLGEKPIFERNVAVASRVAGRALSNARHRVGVMITASQHARARRRTERRGMHISVTQPILCECVEVGGLAGTAEAAELPVAGVVQHDEEDVGCPRLRAQRLRPRGRGLVKGSTDDSRESGSGFVFFECHTFLLAN